jgi:hypothetical protein
MHACAWGAYKSSPGPGLRGHSGESFQQKTNLYNVQVRSPITVCNLNMLFIIKRPKTPLCLTVSNYSVRDAIIKKEKL